MEAEDCGLLVLDNFGSLVTKKELAIWQDYMGT